MSRDSGIVLPGLNNQLATAQSIAAQQQLAVFQLRATMAKDFTQTLIGSAQLTLEANYLDDEAIDVYTTIAMKVTDVLLRKLGVVMRTSQED